MTNHEEHLQDDFDDDMTDEEREEEIDMYKHFPYVVNEEGCYYCGSHWHETVDCDDEWEVRLTPGKVGHDRGEEKPKPDAQGAKHE